MSKPKLNFENAIITVKGEDFVVTEKNEDDSVAETYNLNDELKKFADTEHITFTLKIGKKRVMKPRKPNIKYKCTCGTIIVSKVEELKVQCLVCGEQFEKVEEE